MSPSALSGWHCRSVPFFPPLPTKEMTMVSWKGSWPVALGSRKHPVDEAPLLGDSRREVYGGGTHVRRLFQGALPLSGPGHLSLSSPCQRRPPHHGHQLPYDILVLCDMLTWLSLSEPSSQRHGQKCWQQVEECVLICDHGSSQPVQKTICTSAHGNSSEAWLFACCSLSVLPSEQKTRETTHKIGVMAGFYEKCDNLYLNLEKQGQ